MKILGKDYKKGYAKIQTQNMDDLWYLSQIIENSDRVRGKAERKIKIGSSDNQKVTKKVMTLTISVEKIELTEESLRITGLITDGPDDIPRGVHQSISIDTNSIFTLEKQEWLKYQQEKLKEASNLIPLKILAVIFDREDALFYNIKNQGYEELTTIKGSVAKKDRQQNDTHNFYKEIANILQSYNEKQNPQSIVIASPAFWKEYLQKELTDEVKKKIITATCSEVSTRAIAELMKRPELQATLDKSKSVNEDSHIAELLEYIAKDKAAYGIENVKKSINEGNIKNILITTDVIHDERESGNFKSIEMLLKTAEQVNGKVHIISTKETRDKLNALSGIAATQRW